MTTQEHLLKNAETKTHYLNFPTVLLPDPGYSEKLKHVVLLVLLYVLCACMYYLDII